MKTATIVATICFLGALGAITLFADTALARAPDCPSGWPEQPVEQFFTDSEGVEWFVIRSADSNGYETVRAYRADDGYQAGYVPGSPDEICYLMVRRPRDVRDLTEARQLEFRVEREPEEIARPVSKTLFREFYDRLIPMGPFGPNPDPKWGDLFGVFSDAEQSCIATALGEEGLVAALESSVFYAGEEPRLQDIHIFGCLSEDTGGYLTFAITFAAIVRQVEASGEANSCVQELLDPAVAALSNPNATEEELLAVFAFFFGLVGCGLDAAGPGGAPPSG